MFQDVNTCFKQKNDQGEVDFKEAIFHSREQLKICLSSAATDVEIGSSLKGLSDADKYLNLQKGEELKYTIS